jgi:hypothetical protein
MCDENNVCNAFNCISLYELDELNRLFDRLIIFCENIDEEELEDYECGGDILRLYKLIITLFDRDMERETK